MAIQQRQEMARRSSQHISNLRQINLVKREEREERNGNSRADSNLQSVRDKILFLIKISKYPLEFLTYTKMTTMKTWIFRCLTDNFLPCFLGVFAREMVRHKSGQWEPIYGCF